MFYYTTLNLYLKLIFLRILINFLFFFAGHEEVKAGSRTEKVCSPPGARGISGAGVGHGQYPCKPVNGPCVCWGPQSWWVCSSSFQGPFLSCGELIDSLCFGAGPKRAHHTPTTTTLVALKDKEMTLQQVPLPSGPSEAIAGCL